IRTSITTITTSTDVDAATSITHCDIKTPLTFFVQKVGSALSSTIKHFITHKFQVPFSPKKQIWYQTKEDAMGASRGPRLSGMQKQVLSLYRGFLRAARAKSAEDRQQIESLVSSEFRRNAKEVDRKNFLYIEYLLRRAKKQLDQLRSPDIVGLSALNVSFSQTKHPKN
ncbi:unnamed protein product, partial [Prunus brigantina]